MKERNLDKKKKILIVHNYYQIPGGEDVVVSNEKKMLEKHGHRVILYSRHNSEIKKMSVLRKISLAFTTIWNIKTYIEIKELIKKEQIDVIHIHNTLSLISPSVYYAAVKYKVPVVQTVHNFRFLCPGAMLYRNEHICEDCISYNMISAIKNKCYRNSRLQTLLCVINTKIHRCTGIYKKLYYVCLTEFNKNKLINLKQIVPEKVFVKPNFVEQKNEFVPKNKRKQQFIFVGRLEKAKGVDTLLEAWKIMKKEAPRLIICGTGPLEAWCSKFIDENDLNIDMKGFIPNEQIRYLMAYSQALILPTKWYEGFPMCIVEAFSVGTPAIVSDLGNAGNIVEDGKNGLKFKVNSPKELVDALDRIDLYENIYQNTLRVYNDNYSEEKNYEFIINIYNRLK